MAGINVELALTICVGVLTAKAVWFVFMNILSHVVATIQNRPAERRGE